METKNAWLQKIKEGKGNMWLTGALIGLLFLVIAIPSKEQPEDKGGLAASNTGKTGQMGETQSADCAETASNGARSLEKRLEHVLGQVEGVGEVEVMIALDSSGEKIVEKDVRSTSDQSEQDQADQGKSSADSQNFEETTVYEKQGSGNEMPYVKEVKEPRVAGVIVAAEGGGNSVTAANITEAVMALFDLEAHKIKVMKKQS